MNNKQKMTPQDAIKWVENRMCFGRFIPVSNNRYEHDECHQAGVMAIEALEKQIPQKPSWEYLGDNLSRKEIITLCPCCYESIEEGEHHCKCGQAIDWSDIE